MVALLFRLGVLGVEPRSIPEPSRELCPETDNMPVTWLLDPRVVGLASDLKTGDEVLDLALNEGMKGALLSESFDC